MLTLEQRDWLDSTTAAAAAANHIFPRAAACEAALESGFGQSGLAKQANNLFGMKQHAIPRYETLTLPTREFTKDRGWIVYDAQFVKYPTVADCFTDRMATLRRMPTDYSAALAANTPEEFITEVSKHWSTDPMRASKVLAIYAELVA